jgi:type II pantothenate kinase
MILGIDFGSSYTDFVLMKNRKFIKSLSIPSDKLNLERALKKFPMDKVKSIRITGCYSKKFKKKFGRIDVKEVDEIKAIGIGGKFVSNKKNALVVSVGSGTCIVSVKKRIKHVAGTAVGGRTFLGLSKLLLNLEDCKEILKLAEKGNLKRVDLMMKEIYPKGIGLLNSKGSAAHFGKIRNPNKSDLALAIVNMVSQVIGTVSAFAAKSESHKSIVLTGKLVQSKLVQKIIKDRISKFSKVKIIIPKNAGIATAIGATLA